MEALLAEASCQHFGRTNNGHTPLAAILLCSALGFLSLVGLGEYAQSQVCASLQLESSAIIQVMRVYGANIYSY
jgi:hypothetical protein